MRSKTCKEEKRFLLAQDLKNKPKSYVYRRKCALGAGQKKDKNKKFDWEVPPLE